MTQVRAVLGAERDPVLWMSTLVCLIREEMGFFWVGFYRFVDGELVVGPYQGSLACLRIARGQGVCGACAERKETIIVEDVHRFPGHIACDLRSQSEIVVPVFDENDRLKAVLDIDSVELRSFDETDRRHLEEIVEMMRSLAWIDVD
jgi:GAF domain-containing protein